MFDCRAVMLVNLVLAAVVVVGGLLLLRNEAPAEKPRLDLPGVVFVAGGLFALVYGFSHAQTTSWSNTVTVASFVAAAVLLTLFVFIERRTEHPLLPLRIVLDRTRGSCFDR